MQYRLAISEYMRAFNVTYSFLSAFKKDPAQECLFFSIVGSEIINRYYRQSAARVAVGSCYYYLNKDNNAILALSNSNEHQIDQNFHAWVECEGLMIDFQAPLFREMLSRAGLHIDIPRRMFQKELTKMAASHFLLRNEGDFFIQANDLLRRQLLDKFYESKQKIDLLEICLKWFKKSPAKIQKRITISDTTGERIDAKLQTFDVTGNWQ